MNHHATTTPSGLYGCPLGNVVDPVSERLATGKPIRRQLVALGYCIEQLGEHCVLILIFFVGREAVRRDRMLLAAWTCGYAGAVGTATAFMHGGMISLEGHVPHLSCVGTTE